MSMIGLLTGAPQATGGKAKTDDAAAAGFGNTLQGAMDALAEAGKEQPGEMGAVTGDLSSLVELADTPTDTPTGNPFANLATTPPTGSTLPALPAVVPGDPGVPDSPVPASTSSATVPALPASAVPPVELGATPPVGRAVGSDTATGNSSPASRSTPLVELVETPTGSTLPASTSSATGSTVPAAPATPLVEPGPTTPVPNDASASVGRAVGSENATSIPVPASPGSASASPALPSTVTVAAQSAPTVPSAAPTVPPAQGANVPAGTLAQVSTPTPTPAPLAETPTDGSVSASASSASASASATGNASASANPSAVAVPVSAPAQPVTPAAQVSAPAPAASVPFATQLARPIFSLAAAGAGEHVMTVSVAPDNLGPVTVRAHVGVDGVRVELFAPNELGRDAIRAIIPDLRRDLAGAGLGGNLTLSSQNQPTADGSAQGSNAGQPGEKGAERGTTPRGETAVADTSDPGREPTVDRTGLFGTTSTIDVLA